MTDVSRQVLFQSYVKVTVDETKFTPEFMAEFREHFFDYDTIEEHMVHLGRLYSIGIIEGSRLEFVEGYGKLGDMGIRFSIMHEETDLVASYDEIADE